MFTIQFTSSSGVFVCECRCGHYIAYKQTEVSEHYFEELVLSFKPQSQGLIIAPLPGSSSYNSQSSLVCFILSHTTALNLSIPQEQKMRLKYFQNQKDKCQNSGSSVVKSAVLSSLMLVSPNAIFLILQDPDLLLLLLLFFV